MPDLEAVDLDFVPAARHRIRVERIINAPRPLLWDIITETATWTEWFPTMSRCDAVSQRATLGSSRTVKVGPLVAEETVIVADSPSRWGFCITHTNLPIARRMVELLELDDVSDGDRTRTRVNYTGAIDPPWFGRPTFRITRRQVATTWRHGLDGLAQRAATLS